MAQLDPQNLLPQSSQDALQIFDERYLALKALAPDPTWVELYGEVSTTPALSTRYPMAVLALKFKETIDQGGRFKRIGEKDVELTVVEFDEGVEIEIMKVCSNAFSAKRWADAPGLLLHAENMFRAKTIADMLVANSATCGWDGLALFHDAHLSNPLDTSSATFDNLQATTKNVADLAVLEAEISLMMEVLDENGDPLGIEPDTIFVPRQKFQALKNLLKQDFVPNSAGTATMRNPYNDAGLTVVKIDALTDVNDWYLADSKLISQGVVPWTQQKLAMSGPGFDDLCLRRYTPENSDYARTKGVIGVSQHIYYGQRFLYPHAIRKIAGA
jgi:hypothetical protein